MSLLFSMFLTTTVLLLIIGIYGIVVSRNLMRILLAVEILTKAATLLMLGAGYVTDKMDVAQSYIITIIVIEVMLLVISIGILFGVYNRTGSLSTRKINNLKG